MQAQHRRKLGPAVTTRCCSRRATSVGTMVDVPRSTFVAGGLLSAALLTCGCETALAVPVPYRGFSDPRQVTIRGYHGDAMEPFITPDGRFLLFNNLNQPSVHTTLRYARRLGRQSFVYRGEIAGANDPEALTAVPTVAADGTLYFISPRSYARTLSTIYMGRFIAGRAMRVARVPGPAAPKPGVVNFDVDVGDDGSSLYVSRGVFSGRGAPDRSRLVLYTRRSGAFAVVPYGGRLLQEVNRTRTLVYAFDISRDGLELFFTGVDPGASPIIYRAVRANLKSPFTHVQRVAGATGYVEAPSLSADATALYYHRRVGGRSTIFALTRPRTEVVQPRRTSAFRRRRGVSSPPEARMRWCGTGSISGPSRASSAAVALWHRRLAQRERT